ncbi:alpha/beta fold hydrolase [Bdellovibrio sp. HCB2-146]|uniref:alpha/beta fold hydrolase n=1 Tax=Bdellovibrio sp. HCB2-146 TaxID=3394362 RepID=UPI0039BD29AC
MKLFKSLLSSVLIFTAFAATAASPTIPVRIKPLQDKTVVLVHGAFADGTNSWDKVIPLLQNSGLKVIAVQNPLTSLADDVAATNRAIENATGDVILVGHSWGGVVITEAGGHDKVKSLVYVAAFAPSEGQSALDLAKDYPVPPGFGKLVPDKFGFATLSEEGMMDDFAQDLPQEVTKVMFATQGPTAIKCFEEKVTVAAWKTKPNWYVVAEQDRMIQPDLQTALATKLNAKTTRVASSHVPMQSKANEVANVILQAAGVVPQ